MPPVDEIARQVVSETLGRISQDLVRLQVVPDQNSIEPGQDVKGYHAEIIPQNSKAAKIVIHAPRDAWEISVSFGESSFCEVWYKRTKDAEHAFREELRTILWTIMTSYWQETIVMVNHNRVSCLTSLPAPLGQWRSRIGLLGWVAELIPAPWKLKKLNKWEPYIAQ